MDFVGFIVLVIIKILPARVAMPVIAGVLFLLSLGAFSWHSGLKDTVAYCDSSRGRFSQLFNGSQTANCGLDGILSPVTLIVAFLLLLIALVPAGVWAYQLTHPEWDIKKTAEDLF